MTPREDPCEGVAVCEEDEGRAWEAETRGEVVDVETRRWVVGLDGRGDATGGRETRAREVEVPWVDPVENKRSLVMPGTLQIARTSCNLFIRERPGMRNCVAIWRKRAVLMHRFSISRTCVHRPWNTGSFDRIDIYTSTEEKNIKQEE